MVSSTGHGKKTLNYVHYQAGKFALGTILAAIIPKDPTKVSARFIHLYLSHFKDRLLVPLMKGAANVSLPIKGIAGIEIPFPSLETQNELIDRVNNTEHEHQLLLNELAHQLDLLTRLRQAILQEAVQGQLTAEWRVAHPVTPGDPQMDAAALLAQIQAEKAQRLANGTRKQEKLLPPMRDEEKPFELPAGWVWTRLGEIILEPPRNGFSPKEVHYKTSIRSLKLGATTWGTFNPDEYKYIGDLIPENSIFWLEPGDILIQRSNSIDYVGVSAVYTAGCHEFIYPDLMMKIKVIKPISNIYVHKVLSSPLVRNYYRNSAKGSQQTMPKINQPIVMNTMIPLPPLAEQQAIVARVAALLALLNDLTQQVRERRAQAEWLQQAVLREAFAHAKTS